MMNDNPPEPDNQAPASETGKSASLFRQQAVAYQARSLDGEVLLPLSMRMRILIILAAVIVIGAVLFAANATYARMETVVGWVVPEAGMIRVTARQGGIIESLSVLEGNEVKAGESLARLRLSSDLEEGDAGEAIEKQFRAQAEAVRMQAEAERQKLIADEVSLKAQREAMKRELEISRSRIESTVKRLELVEANAERVRKVAARGFASAKSVEETELTVLGVQQELNDVRSNALTQERQIDDIDSQLKQLPISIRVADAQARASEAQLAQQGTELEIQNTYHVAATVAGRVVAIPVSRGQMVAPQSVIAILTPEGSSLEAELYVPSRSAGFITIGQEIQLMYQAFPYQKFGAAKGHIRSISRTVLAPEEIAITGLNINEPVFRVKVTLENDSVEAYGQSMPVQPGMLLSASIIIDRRTLLEWLLDPIYAVGRLG
ncbi:MAG: HlyD family secretion protein [Paracoccus sp. (in: a-proteobacteria)]